MFGLLLGRAEHDGAVATLEAKANGLNPTVLEPVDAGQGDRRLRAFEPARRVVLDAVATKVLHGWLQNRHQTLLPLTVNFRGLDARDRDLLIMLAAAAIWATQAADQATEMSRIESFLRSAAADEAAIGAFRHHVQQAQMHFSILDEIKARRELSPLAYIVVSVVCDDRVNADALFLQWAAAKLDLPTTVVRSVERRYRR